MKISIFVLSAVLLSSCATAYQTKGLMGGFSSTQLDEHIFKVNFQGNAFTDREKVNDFVLLRSAELALDNGFNYFMVVGSKDYTETSIMRTPTTTTTTSNVSMSAYGSLANAYGNSTTTTYGGQLYHIIEPSVSNMIICFKSKPKDGVAFNAKLIKQSLRSKYKLDKTKATEPC